MLQNASPHNPSLDALSMSTDKTSDVFRQDIFCICSRDICCVSRRDISDISVTCQHGHAAAVFATPLGCLGRPQMSSCLLTQQMSRLQTPQMSCLQTHQMSCLQTRQASCGRIRRLQRTLQSRFLVEGLDKLQPNS